MIFEDVAIREVRVRLLRSLAMGAMQRFIHMIENNIPFPAHITGRDVAEACYDMVLETALYMRKLQVVRGTFFRPPKQLLLMPFFHVYVLGRSTLAKIAWTQKQRDLEEDYVKLVVEWYQDVFGDWEWPGLGPPWMDDARWAAELGGRR